MSTSAAPVSLAACPIATLYAALSAFTLVATASAMKSPLVSVGAAGSACAGICAAAVCSVLNSALMVK